MRFVQFGSRSISLIISGSTAKHTILQANYVLSNDNPTSINNEFLVNVLTLIVMGVLTNDQLSQFFRYRAFFFRNTPFLLSNRILQSNMGVIGSHWGHFLKDSFFRDQKGPPKLKKNVAYQIIKQINRTSQHETFQYI